MIKRVLLCVLLGVGLVYGQSGALSWSIYQVPVMNSTMPGPFATPVFRNVGQTTHQVIVTFLPNPTQLCVGSLSSDTTLQASYDGVVYFSFGVRVNITNPAIPQNNVFAFVGTGAYPRVRFAVGTYNNVTCNITIDYSGATTNPFTQILGSTSSGQSGAGVPPVVVGGFGDGNIVVPLITCNKTTAGTVTAGTTVAVVTGASPSPAPGTTIRVCSLVLDGVTGSATATVLSGTQTTTPCDTTPVTKLSVTVQNTTPPMTYGSGTGAVITGEPFIAQLCITATGGNVTYSISSAIL